MPADLSHPARLLVVVGVIYVASLLGRGPMIDPVRETQAFATSISSTRAIVSGLAYVAAMALHALATAELLRTLVPFAPRAARAGATLVLAALLLTSAVVGAFVYVFPAVGAAMLRGDAGATAVVTDAAGPLFLGSVALEGGLITAGTALLGVATVRAGHPRWPAVVSTLGALLYATPIPGLAAEVTGSFLLIAAAARWLRVPRPS